MAIKFGIIFSPGKGANYDKEGLLQKDSLLEQHVTIEKTSSRTGDQITWSNRDKKDHPK